MILAGVRVVDTLWVREHFLVSKSDTASLLAYTSHEEKKEKGSKARRSGFTRSVYRLSMRERYKHGQHSGYKHGSAQ